MFSELENKVVVITGSGSGIGKAMAEVFGKEKAKVVLNYRSENHMEELDALQETIKKSGGDSITVQADVSVEEDVKRLVETAVKEFGTVDI
ncbi:SDR family NAD(P)-dependent oxidoreductase, partial [Staphylococcus haemolyticus]|uniref:SDR family NAD(P)-dependent oxidoreductase n=2 Tax=Staphylococcus TaxID=1279 RepID=UPI0030BED8AA